MFWKSLKRENFASLHQNFELSKFFVSIWKYITDKGVPKIPSDGATEIEGGLLIPGAQIFVGRPMNSWYNISAFLSEFEKKKQCEREKQIINYPSNTTDFSYATEETSKKIRYRG